VENMAPLRSSQSHGGSRDLLVRTRSDDSSHSAFDEQIQLARWSKSGTDGAKRPDARTIVLNPLFKVVGQVGAVLSRRSLPSIQNLPGMTVCIPAGGLDNGHAEF